MELDIVLALINPLVNWLGIMLEYWYISIFPLFIQYYLGFKIQSKIPKGAWYEKPVLFAHRIWFSPQNLLVSYTFSTVFFLDLPSKPFEVNTMRYKRYKKEMGFSFSKFAINPEWLMRHRYNMAVKICKLLNKSDPNHC
jgi:hypothetical protein